MNGDLAVGRGLNDIALANRIAGLGPSNGAVRPRQGARSECRLDIADNPGRLAYRPLDRAGRSTLAARCVAQSPRHRTLPLSVYRLAPGWCFFLPNSPAPQQKTT